MQTTVISQVPIQNLGKARLREVRHRALDILVQTYFRGHLIQFYLNFCEILYVIIYSLWHT